MRIIPFHPEGDRVKRQTKTMFVFLCIIFISFVLPSSPVPAFLSQILAKAEFHLLVFGRAFDAGLRAPIFLLQSKEKLQSENKVLQMRIVELEAAAKIGELVASENASLRMMLGREGATPQLGDTILNLDLEQGEVQFLGKLPQGALLAPVLASPAHSFYDTLLISIPEHGKVNKGDLVLASPSIVLGKIADITGPIARVLLFSHDGEIVPALLGTNSVAVTITGKGSGNWFGRVPKGVSLSNGAPFRLPGPTFYLLGLVGNITSSASEAFNEFIVASPVNVNELSSVFVLTKDVNGATTSR